MRSIDDFTSDRVGVPYAVPQLPPKPVVVPPTGGPYPPVPATYNLQTGGPLPPTPAQPTFNLKTGGPMPPVQYVSPPPSGTPIAVPPTGGPNQPVQVPPNGNTGIVPPHLQGTTMGNFGPAKTVEDMLNHFLNGQYANNARQRGIEQAAQRGLVNSSIAGGNAQRAALESVQPLVSEGMNLLNNREQRALQQNESALDRQFREKLQADSVAQQDWLANNAYNREFNGNLSLVPIANSAEFMQYLFQMGAQDPEVYTPNVLAGMQNFFTQNFLTMMQQFFPKGGK